ncbi:sugar kinase [Streptosporangium sandarakinum]
MAVAEVVTYGECMLLMVAEPGVPLARARSFRRSVAGAEGNVAIGLARLGHAVRWLGRVGADPAGEAVLTDLRAEGVDLSHAQTDERYPTGVLIRDSHPARAIDVQYHRAGSAACHPSDGWPGPGTLDGARLLHLTGITPMLSEDTRRATGRLLETARERGVTVSFDPNVRRKLGDADRWREVVGPLLRRADILLAGAEELELLTGRRAAEAVADLRADGVGTVVVKNPDRSATAVTAEGSWNRPAFDVPVVDPVGAGDAFAAGFLSATLRGLGPERALAEGATVAALTIQSVTDAEGLPSASQRDRALAAFIDGGETVHR